MNGFDLVSHMFAILPMYMAYVTKQTYLLVFTAIATIISFIYHLNETKLSLVFDEFASCALIVVTFMVYMNNVYKPTYIALAVLLIVVIIDYYVEADLVDFFVGLVVLVAVLVFLYERNTLTERPQRLKVKDAYFASFLSTQIIAVAFFIWDKDPYAHSLWHLFAFVSLGSAIAHIHENDEELKRIVFYCLGSIPSRLFIAAIFIHWNSATYPNNIPIAIGCIVLGLPMLAKQSMTYFKGNFVNTGIMVQGVLYIGIGLMALLKGENMLSVGIGLATSTVISAYTWYRKNKDKFDDTSINPWASNPEPVPKYKKLQLENLRF